LIGFIISHQAINHLTRHHLPLTHQASGLLQYLKRKTVLIPLLTTLGMIGLLSMDIILAKIFLPANQVGLYAGFSLLAKIILYATGPISMVAYTFFTGSETQRNGQKILTVSIISFLFFGLGITLIYKLLPGVIIRLIFGVKFNLLTPLIWLAAIYGLAYSLAGLFAQYLIAQEKWAGLLALPALLIQIVGISFYHQNLAQIMLVNIVAATLLFFAYLSSFIFVLERNHATK